MVAIAFSVLIVVLTPAVATVPIVDVITFVLSSTVIIVAPDISNI